MFLGMTFRTASSWKLMPLSEQYWISLRWELIYFIKSVVVLFLLISYYGSYVSVFSTKEVRSYQLFFLSTTSAKFYLHYQKCVYSWVSSKVFIFLLSLCSINLCYSIVKFIKQLYIFVVKGCLLWKRLLCHVADIVESCQPSMFSFKCISTYFLCLINVCFI